MLVHVETCFHQNCLTGCALTYNAARRGSRPRSILRLQNEENGSDGNVSGSDTESESPRVLKSRYNKFLFGPPPPDPIEGTYTLLDSQNYQEFLAKVGTGPLSRKMVMSAIVQVTIAQELDKRWKINVETGIKAKSVNGYSTYSRKVTENKFKEGEPKPELLEDWDQRDIITTLRRENGKIILDQEADKDQKYNCDSVITFGLASDDDDILEVTSEIDGVHAIRRFLRRIDIQKAGKFKDIFLVGSYQNVPLKHVI